MSQELINQFRQARLIYDDKLSPGDRAILRRCRTASEVLLEGAFWRIKQGIEADPNRVAQVVVCFPAVKQQSSDNFRFGSFLRGDKEPKDGDILRFRQLLQVQDSDELTHRLRRLLTHIDRAVDWGALGRDIFYFFSSDRSKRAWAQDFYSQIKEETND
jgi:CRISPR type I-E-associated protein CasB/Cse2